jgi:hypothetical protein
VVGRSPSSVEVVLVTCDGGQEMDRWASDEPELLAWVGDRRSDEETR